MEGSTDLIFLVKSFWILTKLQQIQLLINKGHGESKGQVEELQIILKRGFIIKPFENSIFLKILKN